MESMENKVGFFSNTKDKNIIGKYKHFKGNEYLVYGTCIVESEGIEYILYERLVNNSFWIRPYDMFFETIERDGKSLKRFEFVENLDLKVNYDFVVATHSESLEEYRVNM